jgi:Prenyltransferase and squalene oxidase repeat
MKHTYTPRGSRVIAPALCLMIAPVMAPLPAQDLLPAPSPAAAEKKPAATSSDLGTPQNPKKDPKATTPVSSAATLEKGLAWLIAQQRENGGWGQGGGWRQDVKGKGRVEGAEVEDPADMGNTCMSLMALMRAGHSPGSGTFKDRAAKAFDFVCSNVEKADEDSPYVTPVRNTQLQVKIGAYVDTFLAGWVLSELKGGLPDKASEERAAAALDKVVRKISKHQKADGSFAGNTGWASVLSQGVCSRALNGAVQKGVKVDLAVLDRDQKQNTVGLNKVTGDISSAPAAGGASTAGVALYSSSSRISGLWDRTRTNRQLRKDAEAVLADASKPDSDKEAARLRIVTVDEEQRQAETAAAAVAAKAGDKAFVAGFGNNGGEEYLSFFNLAEAMRARGGPGWEQWKLQMVTIVCGAQNADGSWTGHHCITGRTFCTATALLTLVQQNMPAGVPVVAEKAATENNASAAGPRPETTTAVEVKPADNAKPAEVTPVEEKSAAEQKPAVELK